MNATGRPPGGAALAVDGYSYAYSQLPLSFSWVVGSTHSFSWYGTLAGPNGTRYLWEATAGLSGSQSASFVVPSGGGYVDSTYVTQYLFTMEAAQGGTTSPVSGSYWKDAGSSVSISATPSAGYQFSGWNGTGYGSYTGTADPATVAMNGPVTETPVFLQPFDFTLSVTPSSATLVQGGSTNATATVYLSSGMNGTAVSLSASGLPSGVNASFVPISGHPTFRSSLTLSASANASLGTHQVTVVATGGNRTHSVVFTLTVVRPIANAVSATFVETGLPNGTQWSITFAGRNYSTTAKSVVISNLSVGAYSWSAEAEIATTAGTRYVPSSHGGTLSVTNISVTVGITYSAQYLVGIGANPPGGGRVQPGSGWYNASGSITISAMPNAGYTFAGWNASSRLISIASPSLNRTEVEVGGPGNITASFAPALPRFLRITFVETGLPNGTRWSVNLGRSRSLYSARM